MFIYNTGVMIKLYNTLSRQVEEFVPLKPGEVSVYSCGPTVYDYAHIGNLRAYVNADMIARMFRANGYKVNNAINITDVGHLVSDEDTGEDKLEKGARRTGKTAWDVARFYTDAFLRDLSDMNIARPAHMPKATDYIAQQIEWVRKLEALGFTYEIPGDGIYYDTSKFPDYGALGHQNLDELKGGARVSMEGKRNPTDFAVWKFSPTDAKRDMEWDSPWGLGFPGWHIECSVMSMETLGAHFDIHTGGIDHIKVHHTNEIAQSEPIVGAPWVKYWMHGEWLMDKSGKMSKSTGEFLTLGLLRERGFDPIAYRYMLMMSHYRSQVEFSWEALSAAATGYKNLVRRIAMLAAEKSDVNVAAAQAEKDAMLALLSNDLHTAEVLSGLQTFLKGDAMAATKLDVAKYADELLGLRLIENAEKLADGAQVQITPEIQAMIDERAAARAAKDWATADRLRDSLAALGYSVNDSK